jgi:hypothetical protein
MKIQIQVEGASPAELNRYLEVMEALVRTGGLSGMKNGSTNIHFDAEGNFMGIRFDYWPWRRRKE